MTKEHETLLKEFIGYERVRGKSRGWLEQLEYKLIPFFQYATDNQMNIKTIKINNAGDFQKYLIDKNCYAPNTIHLSMSALVSFYNYLKVKGYVYSNPFKEVKKIRREIKIPKNVLKENDLINVLEELSKFDKKEVMESKIRRYRLHLACEIMYSTGMRVGESAGLRLEDIDLDRGVVNVCGSKGGSDRICFLNDYTREILRIYLTRIRSLMIPKEEKGVLGYKEESLRKTLNRYLKEVSEMVKVKKLTTHSFRHSFGFHFLRRGCDIRYIKELLGHARLRTTQIYTKVDKSDLKNFFERYHPRQLRSSKDERA